MQDINHRHELDTLTDEQLENTLEYIEVSLVAQNSNAGEYIKERREIAKQLLQERKQLTEK